MWSRNGWTTLIPRLRMRKRAGSRLLRPKSLRSTVVYLQVWKEALDATKVDSASELRDLARVFFPLALREVAPITARGRSATTPDP